jgi:ribosome-associated protein
MTPQELTSAICNYLNEKKAEEITILDVKDLTVLADNFIICTGRNTTQVKALAETLEDKLAEEGIEPLRTEGAKEGRWAVLDYGSVIVHVFNDETRVLFCLEKLWGNGKNVTQFPHDYPNGI